MTTTLKKRLENVVGRLCEVLIPIKHEYYIGEGMIVAVCTLPSMDLFQTIARTADVMNRIRLLEDYSRRTRGSFIRLLFLFLF